MVSCVISIKFLDDKFFTNSFYSKIGGVSIIEFNELEEYFAKMMKYKFFVKREEYCFYFKKLLCFNTN